MAVLTREQIFAVNDLKRELVKVPEWGGEVYVKMFTAREREQFEKDADDARGECNVRAFLCSLSVVNEDGKRMFSEADIQKLSVEKSAAALDRIFSVTLRINRILPEDVEDLAKNSSTGQSGDSSTALPVTSDVPSTT